NVPAGHYRLMVKAYYRCGDNSWSYQDFLNGTENITGMMFAGNTEQPVVSVYSYHFDGNQPGGCWSSTDENGNVIYFPNSMESGTEAFNRGAYENVMEFDHEGGDLTIGLLNENRVQSNWCLFDDFRLEYLGEVVPVEKITLEPNYADMVAGETLQVTATIAPDNATIKKLTWRTSRPQVATVDDQGVVTAIGKGVARITAISNDGTSCTGGMSINVTNNPATAESVIVNEIMASNVDEFVSPAFNFDGWVEFYNPTDRAVELGGIYMSDDAANLKKWHTPADLGVIPSKGFLVVWFDSNNLRQQNAIFKLDVDGGTLYISDADGKLICKQNYPASMERISYARTTDGGKEWSTTATPTPGTSNNKATYATQQLAPPVVNQPSQLFTGTIALSVDIPAGCTLRYTTDGTLPTRTNGTTSRSGQFNISKTSQYRFRLFADGYLPSTTTTRSFIYNDRDYDGLPVVSVVSDPRFLYDDSLGIYVRGKNGRPGNGQSSKCNWNMDWARPVNFSYLDAYGEMVLNQDVDIEMCGGWSRAWTPHSFKLKGEKEYGGSKRLDYPFFAAKPYINNRTLQIRNGGNDNGCRIKDAAIQTIVQSSGIDLDGQSYQPVHEFINGQYIGVLNMREPNNKHYVYANYGWDDDEIDLFEISPDSFYVQKCGDDKVYQQLVSMSAYASDDEVYQDICKMLNIDEYVNYMAAELYLGSDDWLRNNVKAFRHRDGGRFRFVMFDTDHSFNRSSNMFNDVMNMEKNYHFNALLPSGKVIIADITLITIFRQLLQNENFRRKFIDT
ncbi:MAG: CotH kinase family protein, partial [Prevotella sp.]|nr:CotH kinase family protein [Prevotella sp.]